MVLGKAILSYWGSVTFQGRIGKLQEGIINKTAELFVFSLFDGVEAVAWLLFALNCSEGRCILKNP